MARLLCPAPRACPVLPNRDCAPLAEASDALRIARSAACMGMRSISVPFAGSAADMAMPPPIAQAVLSLSGESVGQGDSSSTVCACVRSIGHCPEHEAGIPRVLGLGLPSLHGGPDSLRHGGCVKYTLCFVGFAPRKHRTPHFVPQNGLHFVSPEINCVVESPSGPL